MASVPPGLTIVAASDQCATAASQVTCSVADLAVGETASVAITVRGEEPGPIENCATVSARSIVVGDGGPSDRLVTDGDTDAGNDDSCATVTVEDAAELTVTKASTATSAAFGSTVEWVVTVTNDGPSAARDVVVTERPGAGLAVESATATSGSYDLAAGTWRIDPLASGATATLTVLTPVNASGTLTNRVELASATPDARLARNGSPSSPISAASSGTIAVTSRPLPVTGGDNGSLLGTAFALVAVGAVLFVLSRRRRATFA